ncbi:MAG: hypothetical protein ABIR59_13215 [Gemmatimonadales bacterium]
MAIYLQAEPATSLVPIGAPCVTGTAAATKVFEKARRFFFDADSTVLVLDTLPYKPTDITMVDSSAVCQWVMDSVNRVRLTMDSTATPYATAYVVRADSIYVFAAIDSLGRPEDQFWLFTVARVSKGIIEWI